MQRLWLETMTANQASLVQLPRTLLYLIELSKELSKSQSENVLENNSAKELGRNRSYLVKQCISDLVSVSKPRIHKSKVFLVRTTRKYSLHSTQTKHIINSQPSICS
jgi:hypothetical protein